jgi:hypothetical protein
MADKKIEEELKDMIARHVAERDAGSNRRDAARGYYDRMRSMPSGLQGSPERNAREEVANNWSNTNNPGGYKNMEGGGNKPRPAGTPSATGLGIIEADARQLGDVSMLGGMDQINGLMDRLQEMGYQPRDIARYAEDRARNAPFNDYAWRQAARDRVLQQGVPIPQE